MMCTSQDVPGPTTWFTKSAKKVYLAVLASVALMVVCCSKRKAN